MIVGALSSGPGGLDSGSARVYSGFNGAVLATYNAQAVQDLFGFSVSDAGGVNQDGFDDFIIGVACDDNNGSSSGSVRVYVSGVATCPAAPVFCNGDANGSGRVDFDDLTAVLRTFGFTCP